MILAKNNIIVKIKNTNCKLDVNEVPNVNELLEKQKICSISGKREIGPEEYAILNPVSGSLDLMGENEYGKFQKLAEGIKLDKEFSDYLLERGYAYYDEDDLKKSIDESYKKFKNEAVKSQVQIMLIPTYGCNLACSYCFQHGIDKKITLITRDVVDAFFDYVNVNFSNEAQKPFITLFGGEPLINSNAQKSIIKYIVERCASDGYEMSVVTNGYDFLGYIDILNKVKIKEIQFTLDGSRDVHDSRRATINKKGTFDRIIEGIEAAIKNKMPVNLRSVFDMENIKDIVNLAEYIDKKGWLNLPPDLFKTQICHHRRYKVYCKSYNYSFGGKTY